MKTKRLILMVALALVASIALVACQPSGSDEPSSDTPQSNEQSQGSQQSGENNGAGEAAERFLASERCTACHATEEGQHIERWQVSAHASAGVDPYYLATVRTESEAGAVDPADIQEICAPCHIAMADGAAQEAGDSREFLDNASQEGHALNTFFKEGVSCLVCHQLNEENTFTMPGEYQVPFEIPKTGDAIRSIWGPVEISDDMQGSMENSIGYHTLAWKDDIPENVCAPCHTLYTPTFNVDNTPTGEYLPEQMPYFEWLASSKAETDDCISCHMAPLGSGKLSTLSKDEVANVHDHSLRGPNTFLHELVGTESSDALQTALSESEEFLKTAGQIEGTLDGTTLKLDVINEAGHKLPTAFPSRRVWVHVVAKDAGGNVVFESGAYDAKSGKIEGADRSADHYEPHYETISDPAQVQIYESILGTSEGEFTTDLIYGTHYLKDNRIFPAGFDSSKFEPAIQESIAPIGDAVQDENFGPGKDIITYELPEGVSSVEVELLYQSISYNWAEHFRNFDNAESKAFIKAYDAAENTPRVIATWKSN